MTKTPQQQAEELLAKASNLWLVDEPREELLKELTNLIQAKAERDQLKQQLKDASVGLSKFKVIANNQIGVINQLQSVNAELTKDKERLDFMDGQHFTEADWRRIWSASEIRVVIDQAMKGSK